MKIFTRDYRITGDNPESFAGYFDTMKSCVLDIETTGLDPARSKVILAGLLARTDNGVRITQFLAENHYEEDRVLVAVLEYLDKENIDYLITFNGQSFDVPFLSTRLRKCHFDKSIKLFNFDLYRFLRKYTGLRYKLRSMSQMSLENYYGILGDRKDTITGRESVAMYDEYALTGNTTLEKIILTHNREDVLHLHKLMLLSLCDSDDFDTRDFDAAIADYGFPAAGGRLSCRPRISASKNQLIICGDQFGTPVSAAFFPGIDNTLTIVFNASTSSYEIDIPLGHLGNDYYMDLAPLGIDLTTDPDCVNNYLILNPRTINLISRLITEQIIQQIS